MKFKIHGVRGSVPTPGIEFTKYGGNTSCFEIETDKVQVFCDAGTGFRSAKLLREQKDILLFFTHLLKTGIIYLFSAHSGVVNFLFS